MFRIDFIQAGQGDCIWIEYGNPEKPHRILVDCGPPQTYKTICSRINKISQPEMRQFELLIATHIDIDHIGGLMKLIKNLPTGIKFGDIWFNGYQHLSKPKGTLGVRQAESITEGIIENGLPWNKSFDGGPVMVPSTGELTQIVLSGGMKLTVLSPYRKQLKRLYPLWHFELKKLHKAVPKPPPLPKKGLLYPIRNVEQLAATKYSESQDEANGSSIAILAEYEDQVLLLAGDALSEALSLSLDRLCLQRKVASLQINAFKVSHHGSAFGTCHRLLRRALCNHYLFSSNGNVHGHPAPETIARILIENKKPKILHFNYRTESTRYWNDPWLKRKYRYDTCYPRSNNDCTSVLLN